MKTGRTIQEMAAEIMRQSQAKEDYLVNTGSLAMEVWDKNPMLHLRDANGVELVEPLEIQSTAHQQLGDYLDIPRKYYRRMLGEDANLLAYKQLQRLCIPYRVLRPIQQRFARPKHEHKICNDLVAQLGEGPVQGRLTQIAWKT